MFGERGFTPVEQRCARPTLEINGLTSGYQGEGSKTIVPSWARVKITMRLVPDQDPEKIARQVRKHLLKLCPPTVRMEMELGHGAMGVVYRARHLELNREVALKILPPGLMRRRGAEERFRREAEVVSRLNHPNLS